MNNLFDAQPEVQTANPGGYDSVISTWVLPTSGKGTPDTGSYDVLGRRFSFGVKMDF